MSRSGPAPFVVARRLNGEVAIYELTGVEGDIPIYANPVSTEIRTEHYAVRLARYLTAGSREESEHADP